MYTQEQIGNITLAKRRLSQTGKPQVIAMIDHLMGIEAPYSSIWEVAQADVRGMVRPEKVTEIIPPPAYYGPNSSTKKWQTFAKQVSDMEEEVIDSMDRNDLIKVLTDREIITPPDGFFGDDE